MKETIIWPMRCVVVDSGLLMINNIGAGMGIVIFSPATKKAVGMHVLRAAPKSDERVTNPAYFAATVIPHALEEMKKAGALPPFSVAVAGGGTMLPTSRGDVGQQLFAAVKDTLAKYRLTAKLEQTGGAQMRSIVLNLDEGKIRIS